MPPSGPRPGIDKEKLVPDSEQTSGSDETPPAGVEDQIVGVDAAEGVTADVPLSAISAETADSFGAYARASFLRIRSGESGAGPIIIGLIAIIIFFQIEQPIFLHAANLGNLFTQAAVYVMFGLAEMFALVLSEIDLSVGFAGAVGAFIFAELNAPPVNWPWWLALLSALFVMTSFGAIQGTLIARLGLPSFIVTLAGFLGLQGVMLELAQIDKTALGSGLSLNQTTPVYKLANENMSTALGWIVLAVVLAGFAAMTLNKARNRRKHGLVSPPLGVSILTIVVAAIGGIVLVAICNANRGSAIASVSGVPWVIPFVLVVLVLWTFVYYRTKLGRYMYAVGANPEAARRAGINVPRIRTITFALCGFGACLAGLVYASQLGSIATDYDGGSIVLFAVAAAVIGGTSLFGGRGKPVHSLLGGLIIAVVINGLALMSVSAAITYIVTAVVLLAAVILDAVVRRRATATLVR
jgi:D-xylose transport system permease protein